MCKPEMKKVLAGLVLVSVVSSTSFADPFRILGSRALGMGGAHVAVVGDTNSNSEALIQYWNPAALGLHKGVDIEIPFGKISTFPYDLISASPSISPKLFLFSAESPAN